VDEKTYAFLHHYAKDPAAAYQWMQQARAGERAEGRDERALNLKEEVAGAEVEQGWERLNIMWDELGLRERGVALDEKKWRQTYKLERKKLQIDRDYTDAQVGYLQSKAAEANATARSLGLQGPWAKDSDLNTALTALDGEIEDSAASQFNPEYMDQIGAEVAPEDFKNTVGMMARSALVEHGAGSRATALQGALLSAGFMLGDPNAKIDAFGRDDVTGQRMIQSGGVSYPVSEDVGNRMEEVARQRSQGSVTTPASPPSADGASTALPLSKQSVNTTGRADPYGAGWRDLQDLFAFANSRSDVLADRSRAAADARQQREGAGHLALE
jgi:hypothetical protein